MEKEFQKNTHQGRCFRRKTQAQAIFLFIVLLAALSTVAFALVQIQIVKPTSGTKFSLSDGDPPTVRVPLLAQSGGKDQQATWDFQFSYQTRGRVLITGMPRQARTVFNLDASILIYNQGGKVQVKATAFNANDSTNAVIYVDGTNPSERAITEKLVNLYTSSPFFPKGGTAKLLTGLCDRESNYSQFAKFKHSTYLIDGLWPNDNARAPNGSGGYVGLMQVSTDMSTAFDWTANIRKGLGVLEDKLQAASRGMNSQRSKYPKLPALTATQLEDNALTLYGPYGGSGAYWVPKTDGTAWIKNTSNLQAINYVDEIRRRFTQH